MKQLYPIKPPTPAPITIHNPKHTSGINPHSSIATFNNSHTISFLVLLSVNYFDFPLPTPRFMAIVHATKPMALTAITPTHIFSNLLITKPPNKIVHP